MNKAQLLMFGRAEIRSSPRTLVSAMADIAQKSKIEQRQKSRKNSVSQCLFMALRYILQRRAAVVAIGVEADINGRAGLGGSVAIDPSATF
jgi:hypothetical protein